MSNYYKNSTAPPGFSNPYLLLDVFDNDNDNDNDTDPLVDHLNSGM